MGNPIYEKDCCDTCEYSVVGEVDAKTLSRKLTCVRFPPATHCIATNEGIITVTASPPVKKDGGCGEYKRMSEG